MKKGLLLGLTVFLLLFIPFRVQAVCDTCGSIQTQNQVQDEVQQEVREQTAIGNPDLGELKRNVIEHRLTIRERLEEHRATMAAKLAEHRQERIRAFFGFLTRRMEAAINRLERLISRMESRLAKIEEENSEIDTTSIREEINQAKDKLADASAALSTAKTSLEDILNADDPKTAFTTVRDLLKGIKEQLKEVHQILVKVIGEMRGLRVGQVKTSPTPSPSPTVEP